MIGGVPITQSTAMDVKIIRQAPQKKADIYIVGSRIGAKGAPKPQRGIEATETVRLLWQDPLDEERLCDAIRGILVSGLLKGSLEVAFDCGSFMTAAGELSYVTNVLTQCVQAAVEEQPKDQLLTLTVYLVAHSSLADKIRRSKLFEKLKKHLEHGKKAPVREKELNSYSMKLDIEYFIDSEQRRPKSQQFREVLNEFIHKSPHKSDPEVYRASGIAKQTFCKIMNRKLDYTPSRETVGALCIGLRLGLDDAQKLYNAAGYYLGNEIPVDRVIRFCIAEGIYDIDAVNYCMDQLELPILGWHVRGEKER